MKKKKPFKLKVMGLFNLESEDYTVGETALLLSLVMIFLIVMVIVLKMYALPVLGIPMAGSGVAAWVDKIRKPRAP